MVQRLVQVGVAEGKAEHRLAIHVALAGIGYIAAPHQLQHGLVEQFRVDAQLVPLVQTVTDGGGDVAQTQLERGAVGDLLQDVGSDLLGQIVRFHHFVFRVGSVDLADRVHLGDVD